MIKLRLAGFRDAAALQSRRVSYGQSVAEQPAASSISGTVLDVNGGVVLGAQVTLVASDGSGQPYSHVG